MLEIFNYSFMIRAFIAGIIIAVTAPAIGSFLVIRRFSLFADTLAHIALAGVAIGFLTGTQPIISTVACTIAAAIFIEYIRSHHKIPGDAVLAMFLPGGLALSIVLMSLAHGFNASLFSYLFGSITTVQNIDIVLICLLGVTVIISLVLLYKPLLYASFDEESAQVSGIHIRFVNMCLMVLTAVTISLSMRVVGVLLIGALMVIPVVTAMHIGRSFKQSIGISIVYALMAVISGLFVSYYLDIPAGGTIVLISLGLYGLTAVGSRP